MLARDTATRRTRSAAGAVRGPLQARADSARPVRDADGHGVGAQATLAADQAAVETRELNLQYTRITAPIAGRAGALAVHVRAISFARTTRRRCVVINQMAPIYVTFSVPGRYLPDIRRYQAHSRCRSRSQRRAGAGAAQARSRESPSPAATRQRIGDRPRAGRGRPDGRRASSPSSTTPSTRRPARSS